MQYLYAAEISDFEDTKQHYKNLSNSIHSIHDLYLLEISLLIEIFKKAVNKYNISHDSMSGNTIEIYSNEKFSKNQFLHQIFSNSKITTLISSKDFISWDIDYKFVNLIYDKIIHSDLYFSYLGCEKTSYEVDLKFVHDTFKEIIVINEKFQSFIEEKNIYWMDDYPLVNTLILKLIKNSTENNLEKLFYFKLFSNNKDKKYYEDLASISLKNFESNNLLINKYVTNWDLDRLAKIDLVIINLAVSELINFKEIPIKVSLNEYIEISKYYSTEKSSMFINGILDKIVKDLVNNNSLIKEGRGLRE
tara:strand:- start:166 stop:1080 length:915 start_codon:yes stop_codon:yes gene_type:complete